MKPQVSNLEPFIEILGVTSPQADAYRFGYRLDGAVVSAVDLPAELVEKILILKTRLSIHITPSGEIVPELSFPSVVGKITHAERTDPSIDDLMRETLNPEMLRMEEATSADLALLLERLQRSASLVKDMLDQIARSSPST
ncbi:hypothetical protein [Bradyrhizobium sp. SZCCHNS3004]|uniref:hypothetical protein n=1 Tax=Bradyrhizobium sp. SZCCHNS3004 TaxID=3057312 RepID=UPI002915EAB5|nr:hypothetical protein [Bradyrhizobium sp. SZCCHNS3004]